MNIYFIPAIKILTGFQLLMPLIPSGFMVYFQVTRQKFQARYVLKEETLSIFQRVPNIYLQPFINSSQVSIQDLGRFINSWIHINSKKKSQKPQIQMLVERTSSSLQSDMHVWASWIFMRSAVFIYSLVLLCGARKVSFTNHNIYIFDIKEFVHNWTHKQTYKLNFGFPEKLQSLFGMVCLNTATHRSYNSYAHHGCHLWTHV